MGRAPCCDKATVKKGPWSPDEDATLKSYIEQHGTGGNWIALPQKIGLKRCGKSCRLRWLNYLRPNIRHGGFSEEEDNIICSLYLSIGSRWSVIATRLPGRTDNDIKNYWNTKLKKKLIERQRKEQQQQQALARKTQIQNLKQETEKDNYTLNFNLMDQITPLWPDYPLPLQAVNLNQDTVLNSTNFQYPHNQIQENFSCVTSSPNFNKYWPSFNYNNVEIRNHQSVFQRIEEFFLAEDDELDYINAQKFESIDVYNVVAEAEVINGSTASSSVESSCSWGDISSLLSTDHQYKGCNQLLQGMPQLHYGFD